jgi:hypothetical protein
MVDLCALRAVSEYPLLQAPFATGPDSKPAIGLSGVAIVKQERSSMRRLSAFLTVLGLCALAPPGIVSAAPRVTFKAAVVPIVGFPHTGNVLGAGAAVQIEYTISGTESRGGVPQPLTGVNLYLPAGFRVHPGGLATCSAQTLELYGPIKCTRGSAAGPTGQVVLAGRESGSRPEEGTIESFYLPGGELEFFTAARAPYSLEIYTQAHFVNLAGGGGVGPEMIAEAGKSQIESPEKPSTEKVKVQLGSAYRTGGRAHYNLTLPKKCPRGGFPIKAELKFAAHEGASPAPEERGAVLPEQTLTESYKTACPRK